MSGVDLEDMRHRLGITIYSLDAWYFSDETAETTLKGHFHVNSLEGAWLKTIMPMERSQQGHC
mgnify:CR=1 FL=1